MNNRAVLLVLFLFLAFVWTIYYPEPEIKKLKKEHKKQKKLEKKVKIKIKIKILRISQWILFFVFLFLCLLKNFIIILF
ncbi:hypothetical protein CPX_001275 [Candidatus Phytoplasma pruni]|uniref:Uncharacterized protein n=1 Tax=Candidatus Phytoplasma pruni TaxID=479893 RepID=A0A0M1N102_9MOLU|nr:hypothetical protein CPX_001275 [Candidatus Phytoplasma pruni]